MTKRLRVYDQNPNQKFIDTAVDSLKSGEIIIYPTDSVYALGCDSHNKQALQKLANIKKIKTEKTSLSLICSSIQQASKYVAQLDSTDFRLLKKHLPGPFTFVLPAMNLPKAMGKRKTIGIRIPDHNTVQVLIDTLGRPLVSSSLYDNDDIVVYTTDPDVIEEHWDNKIKVFIDGGIGLNEASTVVDLTTALPTVLRQGIGIFLN